MIVSRGWEEYGMGNCLMGIEFQFCKMQKFILYIAQHCEHTKHYWTVHLESSAMINFVIYVYFKKFSLC